LKKGKRQDKTHSGVLRKKKKQIGLVLDYCLVDPLRPPPPLLFLVGVVTTAKAYQQN